MQKFKKKVVRKRLTKKGKSISFFKAMDKAHDALIKEKPKDLFSAAHIALKSFTGVEKENPAGVIPLPKTGGFLPFLIPLFAGLSALGALSGGAAGIAKAVNDAKEAHQKFEEEKRHNRLMEGIAIGKSGSGLYIKPYKEGLGLYLKHYKQ